MRHDASSPAAHRSENDATSPRHSARRQRPRAARFALALRLLAALPPICAVALASPPAAHAQAGKKGAAKDPKNAEAKKLFDEGSVAYGDGRYEDAVKAWQQSYDLSGKALIFESIANAYERLGDKKKAREYLAKWRAEAPKAERDQLDARIKNLDARIAASDAEDAARKAEEDKKKAEKDAADKLAKDANKSKDEARSKRLTVALAVGGVGVAAVAAGVVMDVVASGQRPDRSTVCSESAGKVLCKETARGAIEGSSTLALAGDIAWIAGAAIAATGVVLFFALPVTPARPGKEAVSKGPHESGRWLSVAPSVSTAGAGVQLRGAF